MPPRMYSPSSPALSSLDHNPMNYFNHHHHHSITRQQQQQNSQCLKFRYFVISIICTTCFAILCASLATHKWIVSKPIRILKLNGGQTNLTSLMLIAQNDQNDQRHSTSSHQSLLLQAKNPNGQSTPPLSVQLNSNHLQQSLTSQSQSNKFQGEIYFGLFKGVKVLNPGFGDRVSSISVLSSFAPKTSDGTNNSQQQHEFINFRLWLLTLSSVCLAILFALIGSIFAIINFIMSPRGTLTGPVGLVIWNATSCFLCLTATVAWLVEYLVRLRTNLLSPEEVQNGWVSDSRSQFGYSYYLVVLAFVLHLVNIFIVSIVQFDTWNKNNANPKRLSSRPVCEGVTMLY